MPSLMVLFVWLVAPAAWAQRLTPQQEYSVPEWVQSAMARSPVATKLTLDNRLNPFCHRGDFDGDGKTDFAVLVKERASGKAGIALIHRGTGLVFVVGAGTSIGNGGDDFSWMDAWIVFDKGEVPQGATDQRPPHLRGDALHVFKTESASGILWWTGTGYRWYQQGD